jgi:hypothetical protein
MFFPFGIFSLLFGFGGLFFYAFLFGIAAVVIGSISLGIIVTHPKKYKGGGIAIIGILLGIFDIVMILTLFSLI